MTRYLVDSNVFIEAKNRHYGFDFCPAFWDWLIVQNGAGKVASIEKVCDEIMAVDDALSAWAKERGKAFFLAPDDSVIPALGRLSKWASSRNYQQSAIAVFLQVADYWLVAHALAHGDIVVTHERPSNSDRKIKIPDACIGVELRCMDPYEMLRREQARFVLGQTGR